MRQAIKADPYLQAAQNAAAARTYRLAVRHGLPAAEREDLHQDILLELLERAPHYDAAKGSVGTFTGVISEHRAIEWQDRFIKDRSRLRFGAVTEAANDPDLADGTTAADDPASAMWAEDRDLFADSDTLRALERAVTLLDEEQAALFDLLAAYQDLPDACTASGMPSATFYRRVTELRMHLRMFGLKAAA